MISDEFPEQGQERRLSNDRIKMAGDVIRPTGINKPANDNVNRQINPTPYEEEMLNRSWKALGEKLSKPALEILPGGKKD